MEEILQINSNNKLLVIDNMLHLLTSSPKKLKAVTLTIMMLSGGVGAKSVKRMILSYKEE